MSPNPLEMVDRGQSRSKYASPTGISTPRHSAAMPNISKTMPSSIRPSGRKEQ